MKKLLLLSLVALISNFNVSGQYSIFKHKKDNTDKKKKEVKKPDPIKAKTKDCELYEGLFNIYQNKKNGKSYIEIDTSHLNNEFIYFSYFENGVTDAFTVRGRYRGSKIIKINKFFVIIFSTRI